MNTVFLKGRGIRKEAISSAAITPGNLVDIASTGLLEKHGTKDGNAIKAFAFENEHIGGTIDTDWASGDQVIYEIMPAGAEIYALVPANAPAIVIGDYLTSNGDGTLIKATAAPATTQAQRASIVARAIEAVDNSAVGAISRIQVEVV